MLKLLRNHLLEQGFELEDGICIQKATLQELVKNKGKEMNTVPKLTTALLELKGAERMRVSPAAKIFSNRTATLSQFVFPAQPEIADFFQLVNDWFDIFNSRVARDNDVEIRSAFGMAATKQALKLNEMESLIASSRSRL